MAYNSVSDIRRANKRAGHHFFDAATTRAFGSRYGRKVYGGYYFTESSPFPTDNVRTYTIRRADDSGHVSTVYAAQPDKPYLSANTYRTRRDAVRAIENLLAHEQEGK